MSQSAKRPFNTSSKAPLSTKLRNFNASKSATRQLEVDSRRMEERLRELKMTMSQEKEQRERQGSGGFWRSGKEGALTSQVPKSSRKSNSNNTEMPRPSKPKKITVLKDGPIKIPKRAQRPAVNLTVRKSFSGPACGQCEEKATALSCMECSELYCAACFAQFHLKGALKLHRSVPYQAGQELRRSINDGSLSPRTITLNSNQNTERTSNDSNKPTSPVSPNQQQRPPPVSKSNEQVTNGHSLLDGEYNEQDSSASFAAALAEWRGQPQVTSKVTSSPRQSKPEVATVNEGTGTDQQPKPEIKIEFKELSMSYADKLLLKKHRRTELPQMQTPRQETEKDTGSRMLATSTGLSESSNTNISNDFVVDEDDGEELELQEEHLRYASLFSTSSMTVAGGETRCKSMLTITPLPDDVDISIIEEETSYLVQEDPDDEPVMYTAQQTQKTTTARNNHQNKSIKVNGKGENERSVKKQQTKSTNDGRKGTKGAPDKQRLLPRPPSENSKGKKTKSIIMNEQGQKSLVQGGSKENKVSLGEDGKSVGGKNSLNVQKRTSSRNRKLLPSTKAARNEDVSSQKNVEGDRHLEGAVEVKKKLTPKRPGSAQNKRQSSGRSSKTDGMISRDKMRPASAGITRQPSEELVKASKLAWKVQHQYKHGLDEFFTAGLGGQEPDTEQPTAEASSTSRTSLQKCSFQGAGYWRPDSSLSTAGISYTAVTQFNEQENEQVPQRENTISWKLSLDTQRNAESPDSESITPTPGLSSPTKNVERTPPDGRDSRPKSCIQIEGDDFSIYDENYLNLEHEVTADDEVTLQQLASELESGRNSEVDGPISRLSMLEDFPDGEYEDRLGIEQDDGLGSGLSTPCDELCIEQEMDEESMMGDFEEEERIASVMEVNSLQ